MVLCIGMQVINILHVCFSDQVVQAVPASTPRWGPIMHCIQEVAGEVLETFSPDHSALEVVPAPMKNQPNKNSYWTFLHVQHTVAA